MGGPDIGGADMGRIGGADIGRMGGADIGRMGGADMGRIGGADMGGGAIMGGTMPLPIIGGPDICAAGASGRLGMGGGGMDGRRGSSGGPPSAISRSLLGRAKPP